MQSGGYQGSQFNVVSFMLKAKSWRKSLPELRYKFMVAAALNQVLYETGPIRKKFLINGYLITGKRIYIIGKLRSISVDSLLILFYESIKISLLNEGKKILEEENYAGKIHADGFSFSQALFEVFPFHNEWLKQLLVGHTVHLRYYEPRLARIKDIIEHEPFCSVIDYMGGEGPVVVSKQSHPQQNKTSKTRRSRSVKRKKL